MALSLRENGTNFSQNETGVAEGKQFDIRTVQLMCFPIIIVIGLVGNTLICIAIRRRSRLRVTDCFIVNLAITDLATCLISIPFDFVEVYQGEWPFDSNLCKTVYPLQTILISVSVYTLLCMSLERRRAIIRPFMPKFKRWRVFWGICVVWIFSISLMGPYVAILDVKYTNSSRECIEKWPGKNHAKVFTLAVFFMLFLLPLFAITTNYLTISLKLWKDIQRIKKAIGKSPNQGKRQLIKARAQRNMRIVKIFVIAVIVFAVCMAPNHFMWIWHDFGSGTKYKHFTSVLVFCNTLIYANSAINPFIFISLHSRYCKDIANFFPCCQKDFWLFLCSKTKGARDRLRKYRRNRQFSQARRKAVRGKRNKANKLAYLRGSPWERRYDSSSSEICNYNKQFEFPKTTDKNRCDYDFVESQRKPKVNFGGEKILYIEDDESDTPF